jgi:hypothetical protein
MKKKEQYHNYPLDWTFRKPKFGKELVYEQVEILGKSWTNSDPDDTSKIYLVKFKDGLIVERNTVYL